MGSSRVGVMSGTAFMNLMDDVYRNYKIGGNRAPSTIYRHASPVVLSRMQLTLHATRGNTSRHLALGAGDVGLVSENSTCSVPAL